MPILIALAISQAVLAQAPRIRTTDVRNHSNLQIVSNFQVCSVRTDTAIQQGFREIALLANPANSDKNVAEYALLESNDGNTISRSVLPGEYLPANGIMANTGFRPIAESQQGPPIRLWRTLLIVQHGAAAFDAWSTRDAIQNSGAHELNPFFRPFADSNAIYAATQVESGLFDYLGRRMMESKRGWMRKFWWVPQVAGTVGSFFSGAHNLMVTRGSPSNSAP